MLSHYYYVKEVDSDYYDELPKHHYIYRQDPIEQRGGGGGEDYRIDQDNDHASPKDQEPQGIYGHNDTRSPNQSEQDGQEPEPAMPVSHGLMTLHERMKREYKYVSQTAAYYPANDDT